MLIVPTELTFDDPLTIEVRDVIDRGDLVHLRRLHDEQPQLATARLTPERSGYPEIVAWLDPIIGP